jgi:hypothetical protein
MKGFFSFAVVLGMILILFWFNYELDNNGQEIEVVKNELMKIEQANKERTLLENNVDKIIATKLTEQILKKNFNITSAQNEINKQLFKYLENKVDATNLFYEKKFELNISYLNKNTSVILIKAEGLTYGEYDYTSNITKNEIVGKKIGNKLKTNFQIPTGYSQKIIIPTG